MARWGSRRTNQFKYSVLQSKDFSISSNQDETHLGRLEQVGHPDTVSQNAEGALRVALDNVVIDAVKQGDHWVVCEGTLNLCGIMYIKLHLLKA